MPPPSRIAARILSRRVPLPPHLDPSALFAALTDEGRTPGSCLLESADRNARAGLRSLLFPEPLLRLTADRTTIRVRALGHRGLPLLLPLAARVPGAVVQAGCLEAPTLRSHPHPGLDDRERLGSPSVLDAVRALLRLVEDTHPEADLPILVAGALTFELVDHFEALPPRPPDPFQEDDLDLVLVADSLVVDHARSEIIITTRALMGEGLDGDPEARSAEHRLDRFAAAIPEACRTRAPDAEPPTLDSLPAAVNAQDPLFEDGVRRVLDHIQAGDVFQCVLSRTIEVESAAPSMAVYRQLRRHDPSPYLFHFDMARGSLLGASPETCVAVHDRMVSLSPIAGTAPRGSTPQVDRRWEIGLRLDAKEQAEHAMLVDLARNDVARIAVPGTRRVEEALQIARFRHVQHLVTRVVGVLHPDLDALDAYRASANMGTLTGAPKLRATEIIRGLEDTARGYYGGAMGYVTARGDMDTCIVIRSLRHREGRYTVRAGAGVVRDSDPARELAETTSKASTPLLAVLLAEETTQ